jgi:hypothetical protein
MGILDRLKGQASGIKQKATEVVDKNSDKIHAGIDKAGDFVDKKTKGKYSEKIEKAKGAAEKGLDKLDNKSDDFPAEQSGEHVHEHRHGDDEPHAHPHEHLGEHTHEHPETPPPPPPPPPPSAP